MATKASQSPPASPPQAQPSKKPAKKAPEEPPPQPLVPDPATRLQRCQSLSNSIIQKLKSQITAGDLPISERTLHITIPKQQAQAQPNPEKSLSQKISQLNNDLTSLQKQISLQKQHQKLRDEQKRKQAKQMIERLKKQKQQYRSKLKISEMNNRLKNSVLSEDVLKAMRDRRDSLISEKKRDMEERIYKNISRRVEREQDQNNNEVNYWQKIKQIQTRKRHHSTKQLPTINNLRSASEQPQFGINLSKIERKNSHRVILAVQGDKLGHKRSYSKQELIGSHRYGRDVDYSEIVNRFLERAKAKMESKSQKVQGGAGRSRLNTFQAVSEKGQGLGASRVYVPLKNQRIEKIVGSYIQNKHKLLGNQYLKQSLLRVSRTKSPTSQQPPAQQSLELKGNPVLFHRNNKLTSYQQRRNKIFQLLLSEKLDKPRAIEMLNPIESMLDRLSPEGIEERLMNKLEVFREFQKIQDQKQKKRRQYQSERQLQSQDNQLDI